VVVVKNHAEYQFTFDLSIKKTNKLPPEEIKEYYQYLEKQSEKNKSETLSSSQNRTSDSETQLCRTNTSSPETLLGLFKMFIKKIGEGIGRWFKR
jgi:hypothetical protein